LRILRLKVIANKFIHADKVNRIDECGFEQ
jgi:hypothetical protein